MTEKKKYKNADLRKIILNDMADPRKGEEGIPYNNYIIEDLFVLDDKLKTSKKLFFENCVFEKGVEINQLKTDKYLGFSKCVIHDELFVGWSELGSIFSLNDISVGRITIHETILENGLSIFGKIDVKNINISNVSIGHENIELNDFDSLENISLDFGNKSKGQINLSKITTKSLNINGVNSNGFVTLNDIKSKFIRFDIVNNQTFIINNLSPIVEGKEKSHIIITNSSFSKTYFTNIDFRAFNYVTIYDSFISDIISNSVKWPEKFEDQEKNDYPKLKETYRQLKTLYSKQGDKVNALHFEKLEMQAFNKSITWFNDFGNKFVLVTNRLSNEYGTNWIRTFCWIVIVNATMFSKIKADLGFSLSLNSADIFNTVSEILLFINPLHNYKLLGKLEGLDKFIDVFGRLVNSYLIFQFLKAFRKFAP